MSDSKPPSMSKHEAVYVFRYYPHLWTEQERLAYQHFAGTIKATHGRDDVAAQEEAKTGPSRFSEMLSENLDVTPVSDSRIQYLHLAYGSEDPR